MSEYKPVPVEEAKRISDVYQKSMVVMLCYDAPHQLIHTTTYGVSAFDKEQAAALGTALNQQLGGDLSRKIEFEDFHKSYDPAIYAEAIELLKLIRSRNGASPQMVQQAERILKSADCGLRQG